MKELLETIVSELVENKDAVEVVVDEPNAEGIVVYHLHVAPDGYGQSYRQAGQDRKGYKSCNACRCFPFGSENNGRDRLIVQ